jgi:ABC-2 type transport system permease protein
MNTIGFRTLFAKETRRFLRVPGQTLAQPIVTTALYFLVFGYALGGRVREVDGVPYSRFIVPGLMLLGLSQNAFLNTSSSMFIGRSSTCWWRRWAWSTCCWRSRWRRSCAG